MQPTCPAAPLPRCPLQVDEPSVWSELANSYLDHAQVREGALVVEGPARRGREQA